MLRNVSSQEKLEIKPQEDSFAETVGNISSLENMARTVNKERQNATELSQEAEIGTTKSFQILIQWNESSNTQSATRRNLHCVGVHLR